MGLLDGMLGNVLGNVLGGQQGGNNPLGAILAQLGGGQHGGGNALLQMAMQLLQQKGGLAGLVQQFQGAGLGQQVNSWVSTGANLPIDQQQLSQALGNDAIGNIAQQLGVSTDQAGSGLTRLLPELVNQLTPNGQIPDNANDILSQAMAALTRGR